MKPFASPLGPDISRFLAHKRGLGFAYDKEEWFLHDLDRIAATRHDSMVSEALVREYLAETSTACRSHRLTAVRQLARFLVLEEPGTFVPPARFLCTRRRRSVIRVLTRYEAGRFLDACDLAPKRSRSIRPNRTSYPPFLDSGNFRLSLLGLCAGGRTRTDMDRKARGILSSRE